MNIADVKLRLDELSGDEIAELVHDSWTFLYWWMGDPTEERLQEIRSAIPVVERFIDFETVRQRLTRLDSFKRGTFGVSLDDFFPELKELHRIAQDVQCGLPKGIQKAESWLRPIAKACGADADVEAAVYFASRGQSTIVDVDNLRNAWHASVCDDIGRGKPVGKVPQSVLDLAHSRTLSLAESAKVLTFNHSVPRFFSFRDEEEDFIDAAMFRAAEWFGIKGFEPWLNSLIADLSDGPVNGIDHISAAWWLFHWCRSDLALQMANRQGLEMWLWALCNGPLERTAPWRTFWGVGQGPLQRDYLPVAGILSFISHRTRASNLSPDIIRHASELLFQTQMRSGAWPLYADDSEPCLLATCTAIHGLAASKPQGWITAIKRASTWIANEQGELGAWSIQGGPAVMLTVLALDSLALVSGDSVTFGVGKDPDRVRVSPRRVLNRASAEAGPIYAYEGQPWFAPAVPPTKSLRLEDTQRIAKPELSIVVATETELRQVLRVLAPKSKKQPILKVTSEYDTFYLGLFGSLDAVILLSSMGSAGVTGSTLSVDSVIRNWNPRAIVLLGIAFGASRTKHREADVLIAESLIPYELQRRGNRPQFRNPIPPSSPALVNRFRHAFDWSFRRPDNSECARHVGPLLSGEKLIDNSRFKSELLKQYPNAIGGEMEGTGLWSAADRAKKAWIIVKGVCDWADGAKNDSYQTMAAAAAVSLCAHVFSDAHALDGL